MNTTRFYLLEAIEMPFVEPKRRGSKGGTQKESEALVGSNEGGEREDIIPAKTR